MAFRSEGEQRLERSDAGISIVQEVFAFVKENHPERSAGSRPLAEKGVRGKGRQPFFPPALPRSRRALARRLCATLLTHGIPTHLDAMRVVNQPVEDAIGGRGVADLLVPARHW